MRSQSDFQAAYAGKRVSGSCFIIYYRLTENGRKVGFAVSKKVSKSAVLRNKLKRRLREIYRLGRHILPCGVELVIRAFPQAAGVDFNGIKAEITGLFSRIASEECGNRFDKSI